MMNGVNIAGIYNISSFINSPLHSTLYSTLYTTDAVTHARFVGTDASSDEVVLMKILHVLRTIVLTPVGALLTNEAVCEIMQSCFRICFEMRLSELLRKAAEHTLVDMIQLLFSRLPHFHEDIARYGASTKRLKIGDRERTGGKSALQRKSPRLPNRRQHPNSNAANGEADGADPGVESPEETAASPTDSAIGESVVTTPPSKGDRRQEIIATTPVAPPSSEPSFAAAAAAASDADAASTAERDADSVPENQSDGTGSLQGSDFVNPRGVRFTVPAGGAPTPNAASHGGNQAGSLVPYGLPCVRELFRFLISLINPNDRHNSDVMTHMGVALVTVALESGVDHIPAFPSLLVLVKVSLGFGRALLHLSKHACRLTQIYTQIYTRTSDSTNNETISPSCGHVRPPTTSTATHTLINTIINTLARRHAHTSKHGCKVDTINPSLPYSSHLPIRTICVRTCSLCSTLSVFRSSWTRSAFAISSSKAFGLT